MGAFYKQSISVDHRCASSSWVCLVTRGEHGRSCRVVASVARVSFRARHGFATSRGKSPQTMIFSLVTTARTLCSDVVTLVLQRLLQQS